MNFSVFQLAAADNASAKRRVLPRRCQAAVWFALLFGAQVLAQDPVSRPQYPNFPSETPEQLNEATEEFDYVKREAMIPMRDGVKLFTVIVVPKGAKAAPILLTRTPYDAAALTSHAASKTFVASTARRAITSSIVPCAARKIPRRWIMRRTRMTRSIGW